MSDEHKPKYEELETRLAAAIKALEIANLSLQAITTTRSSKHQTRVAKEAKAIIIKTLQGIK